MSLFKKTAQFLGFSPLGQKAPPVFEYGSAQVIGMTSTQLDGLKILVDRAHLTDADRDLLGSLHAGAGLARREADPGVVARLSQRGLIAVDIRLTDEGREIAKTMDWCPS